MILKRKTPFARAKQRSFISPLVVESQVALLGLIMIRNLGIKNAILEGHALTIINLLIPLFEVAILF